MLMTTKKAVAFTDLHIHNYKQFSKNYGEDRLDACLHILDVVYAYADKIGTNLVLFSGDLFDSQRLLPTIGVNKTIERFQRLSETYPDVRFVAISGNHDHASKNLLDRPAVSALEHLNKAIPNFLLVDNSYTIVGGNLIVGIPYYENTDDFSKALDASVNLVEAHGVSGSTVLLTHQTPDGTSLDKLIEPDFSMRDKRLDVFDFVLNGHIHGKTEHIKNRVTLGTPLHRDLDDVKKVKGGWELDLENKVMEFVSFQGEYPEIVIYEGHIEDMTEEMAKHLEGCWVVPRPPIEVMEKDIEVSLDEFSPDMEHGELLRNFWKREDGKDKGLLETGLSLLKA